MKTKSLSLFLAVWAGTAFLPGSSAAELQLKQTRNTVAPTPLTAAERAELGDPFFERVLKNNAEVTLLKDIVNLIEPAANKRRVFVVDEQVVKTQATGSRRTVIDFDTPELRGNVMIAPILLPNRYPAVDDDLEAWGWDDRRGRYNYYRMDNAGSNNGPVWKFRGSSEGADLLSAQQRAGTCLECHISGGPVMKELLRPWNNWSSLDSLADYLTPGTPNAWPVTAQLPQFGKFTGAEILETPIFQGLRRFNNRRLAAMLKLQPGTDQPALTPEGRAEVLQGQRLLRPLFETVECNLSSSLRKSGLHRFNAPADFVPALKINPPNSAFLNVGLIAGGQLPVYAGLKIIEAEAFSTLASLTQEENRQLVAAAGLGLLGRQPGDAQFAWFGPEPSHVDMDLVDQCLRRGVITPHFLAAVLAVDLETPVFSARRAALLRFIPATFPFKPRAGGGEPVETPRDAANDFLTAAVIQNIEAANPAPDSTEAEFLTLLKSPDAVPFLKDRVIIYRDRVRTALSGDAATRQAELTRLFNKLIVARKAMLDHPNLHALDETGNLFPKRP
jgi:hypothetical protein